MNGRSGVFKFFLFLFLGVIITIQVLSMLQADRLFGRLNALVSRLESSPVTPVRTVEKPASGKSSVSQEYPGDEGDWLIWNLDAEPATLNPVHTLTSVYTVWITRGYVSHNIFEALLEYDLDELRLKPCLAESYGVSADGLEITFHLRDNIWFSDGHPITSEDVVFTYETIVNPGVDAASLAAYYSDVNQVFAIDEKTVRFIMKKPYFKSLEVVSLGDSGVMPKHIYQFDEPEQFNKRISNPVGSGPYIFEKWDMGREIVLRRNETYWGPKPKLKKIVYKFILNHTAAVQSLRAGEIDYMRPLTDQFYELSNNPDFTKENVPYSYWTPFVGYFWIGWNQDKPFFKDRRVRFAMTCLVDREAICKQILKVPDARVPTGPFYILGRQGDPNIKPWPYDTERAKQLLDESGWIDHDGDGIRDKDGVAFRFKYMIGSDMVLHEQIAKFVKDSAAKAGIEINIEPYEWSVFSQRLMDRQFDAVNLAWHGVVEDDPYQIWHSSQIGNRGSNYVGFRNAEADGLIEEARITLDEKNRNEIYHRFHRILHDEQPYTFVYTRPEQRFLNKRFENVIVHKLGINESEWYVPKEKQRYK